jgi:hypothetical protein
MPLIRPSKLPPPPELGEKTLWDYFPRRVLRRVFFMLLALGAVLFLRSSGGGSFGGLFDPIGSAPIGSAPVGPAPARQQSADSYHRIEVKPPNAVPAPKSQP